MSKGWIQTIATVAVAATCLGILTGIAPGAQAASTLTVAKTGTDTGDCIAAPCLTIQFAIGQAVAGDTVSVGPGIFAEAVSIDKDITLDCAQHGTAATATNRTVPADETVIAAPSGSTVDLRYGAGAPTGTVDGCTLAGGATVVGILAVESAGTGYTWVNNIIDGTQDGINFFSAGPTPTEIAGSRITNQQEQGGGGVMFTTAAANKVTVENNVFDTNPTDINSISGGAGIVVQHNASTGSDNFAVWANTSGALITANTVTNANGSAIFVDGNNAGTTISGNTIAGGAATGIRVGDTFYPATPSSGLSISGNTIRNRSIGIRISPESPVAVSLTGPDNAVTGNFITGSTDDGIVVQAGSVEGLTLTSNTAKGSTHFDCHDLTTGTGTAGTANTWTTDNGLTGSPLGLCESYVGQSPVRILDTRPGSGTQQTLPSPLVAGQTYSLTVAGLANVPANALAVALNVTAVIPHGAGYLKVFPDNGPSTPLPNASTVNFNARQTVANFDVVALPSSGNIDVEASVGADVVIDVVGYFTAGSDYLPQDPARVLDTRAGSGHQQTTTGPITPGTPTTVSLGTFDGPTSVAINVTAVGPAGSGYLKVYPVGAPQTASTINYIPGHNTANFDIVNVQADGNIVVQTAGSTVDVVIDVAGSAANQFTTSTPVRIMDTRPGSNIGSITGPVAPGTVQSVQVAGVGGVPMNAKDVLINVTAVLPGTGGNLRVYPDTVGDGTTLPPHASTINYTPGQITANFVIVQLPPDGRVNFYSAGSSVDVLFDVIGYVPRTS